MIDGDIMDPGYFNETSVFINRALHIPMTEEYGNAPGEFAVRLISPNSVDTVAIIEYELPEDVHVVMKLHDVLGRVVLILLNENKTAGYHRIPVYARDLASGEYYYSFITGSYVAMGKLIIRK